MYFIHPIFKVFDGVVAVTVEEGKHISTGIPIENVISETTRKRIIAFSAPDRIRIAITRQDVRFGIFVRPHQVFNSRKGIPFSVTTQSRTGCQIDGYPSL